MTLTLTQMPVCNELIYYIASFLHGQNLHQFAQTCKDVYDTLKETKIYKKALKIARIPSKILHMKTFIKNFQITNSELIKDISELKLPVTKSIEDVAGDVRFSIKEEFKVGESIKSITKECTSDLKVEEKDFSIKLAAFKWKLQQVKPEQEKIIIGIFLKKISSEEVLESNGTLEKIYRLFKRVTLFIDAYRKISN